MRIVSSSRLCLMLFTGAWLAASAGGVCAQQEAAGRFLSATGDIRIVGRNGGERPAARAAEIREGESIVTGSNGLGQLRMSDGTLMSVRADTELKLDRFAYSGQNDPNPSFLLSVAKGGFRTITGLIGKIKRDSYKVTTPSATIGIRGTDFELVHIQQPLPSTPPGTYNRVFDGATTLQNRAGAILLVNRDQTAFVGLQGTTPPVLVAPPGAIFGRPTPPPAGPRSLRQDDGKSATTEAGAPQSGPASRDAARATPLAPTTERPALLNPIDAPRTVLTPIDGPRTTVAPIDAPRTVVAPIDTAPRIQTAPVLTPIDTPMVLEAPRISTPIIATPVQTAPAPAPVQTAPAVRPPSTPIQTTPTIKQTAPLTPITRP
jgi:hypothetical protein